VPINMPALDDLFDAFDFSCAATPNYRAIAPLSGGISDPSNPNMPALDDDRDDRFDSHCAERPDDRP
jgi:hypothetical protein